MSNELIDKIISVIKLWRPVFFSKIKTEEDFKELYEELYKLLKNL